jgi:hypothetical protein
MENTVWVGKADQPSSNHHHSRPAQTWPITEPPDANAKGDDQQGVNQDDCDH